MRKRWNVICWCDQFFFDATGCDGHHLPIEAEAEKKKRQFTQVSMRRDVMKTCELVKRNNWPHTLSHQCISHHLSRPLSFSCNLMPSHRVLCWCELLSLERSISYPQYIICFCDTWSNECQRISHFFSSKVSVLDAITSDLLWCDVCAFTAFCILFFFLFFFQLHKFTQRALIDTFEVRVKQHFLSTYSHSIVQGLRKWKQTKKLFPPAAAAACTVLCKSCNQIHMKPWDEWGCLVSQTCRLFLFSLSPLSICLLTGLSHCPLSSFVFCWQEKIFDHQAHESPFSADTQVN